MFAKLLFRISEQSFGWVGHVYGELFPATLPYLIHHHKMVLVPMDNARQRHFVYQRVETKPSAHGFKTNRLGSLADTEQRNPVFAQGAKVT